MPSPGQNWLLYDGDCPFCSRYVAYLRLREAVGPVTVADARSHPELLAEALEHAYDLNEGMLLKLDGRYYHGADCINVLALLSTPSGIFNRVNRVLFRSKAVSRLSYPALRAGRNLALKLLGREQIKQTNAAH
jgi:predicted DCC family thiol-disulfide oxidoreductase YuxK